MRRKFLSVVLCVCMMFTMVPFAFAADGDEASAETTPVATITTTKHDTATGSDTTTVDEYDTLQAAIDAAKKGATVQLVANTNENVTIAKDLTLDLNGFTLNGGQVKHTPALTVTARVTVKDSSTGQTGTIKREDTAENSGTTSHYVIDIQGNGWLTFESGNIENNSGIVGVKGASLVRVGDDSVSKYPGLNIKGGTFTQNNFIAIKVDRGNLFLNGGTINCANTYAIENWHKTTIKAGTINGIVASWTYNGGANSSLQIKGGTINGNVNSVNYGNADGKKATVSITGGTITGELDTRSYDPTTNTLTSINDPAKATIEVTGGTFTKDPTKYLADGIIIKTNNDGKYIADMPYIATVDGQGYYDIASAFRAQTDSKQPIILQRNCTNKSVFNSGSIDRVLDLNGYTYAYTGTEEAFDINYSNVTLTVKNGTVTSTNCIAAIPSANNGSITYNHSTLVFDKVTMTANGSSGIESNGNNTNDAITLKNSTLNVPNGFGIYFPSSGTATIEDSTINAKTMGIQVCAGSLNVKNSKITVTGDPANKTESDGAIEDGAAISVVDRAGYKDLDKVTVESGKFAAKDNNSAVKAYKWNNSTKAEETFDNSANTIAISGGYFTTDPAAYCAPGYMALTNTDTDTSNTYKYKVGQLSSDTNNDIEEITVPGATETSIDKNFNEDQKKTAEETAKTVAPTNTLPTDSVNISANDKNAAVTELVKQKKVTLTDDGKVPESTTITVVKQPYLDVVVTTIDTTESTATIEMNITPKYNLVAVATTGETPVKPENGYVIDSACPLTITTPTEVSVNLPDVFKGKTIYIKHSASNGKVYYYTATADTITGLVKFTTKNGFSPFVFSLTNGAVAEVNGTGYDNFQNAVDAAQNNDEITLLKGDAVSATMTGSSKTIKVKAGSGVTTPINVTVNGENKTLGNGTAEVTFTYPRPSSGGPGSSGGSISTPTTYAVNVNAATNGAVAADKKTASKGTTVTVTASPSKGYVVDAVKVVDKDGKDVAVTEKDGKYVFTMPASAVTVTGSFKAETPAPAALPFTDVKSGNWFYDAVKYAYEQGLMTGTSATTFAPNGTMNRAMIVTVLYRLEKSPAVTGASKFTDVPAGQWYSDAVAWAAANKIVNGYDETTFGPMNAVTREQMAAILFRYEQVKGLENVTLEENLNRFPDQNKISAYAIPALQWAVGQKIINGNADGTLDPTGTATRAQVAQIFTNLLNK